MNSAAACRLLELIEDCRAPYGREDSFKMAPGRLITGRFLIGIPLRNISAQAVVQIAAALGMPQQYLPLFREQMAEANLVFFGVEESETQCVCKAYLEFWEKIRRRVLATDSREPALLHLGFKWSEAERGMGVISRYTCHPMLDLAGILAKMRATYRGCPGNTSCQIAVDLILSAARRNNGDFIYLEVDEEGTPRNSFDINLYKAGFLLRDVEPLILRAARHFRIAPADFAPLWGRIAAQPFGHISGGIGRDGRDFLTFYYETRPLD